MQLQALCRSDGGWEEVDDLAKILELHRDPSRLVWIGSDVSGATEDDVRALATEFDLDELAMEDALQARQRPKLEPYPGHLLVILYQLDEIADQLEQRQIAAFVGRGFVIVLHHGAGRLLSEARARVERDAGEVVTVDDLVHALLDAAVDDYELKAAALGDDVEELEMQGLSVAQARARGDMRTEVPDQAVLYTVKQQLSMLRRYALPLSRALDQLAHVHEDTTVPPDERELQFRDVEDHLLRLGDKVRSIDELASGVLDLTRSIQADDLNDINKKLTGWAAVIAAPALIVGLYGTNYGLLPTKHLGNWGFVFVLGLMFASAFGLYVVFKRRRWI
jgi:magnesium transporter